MDLHVFIEVFGPPCEAYTRMAHAMEEVKKFLVPVCIVVCFFGYLLCSGKEKKLIILLLSAGHILNGPIVGCMSNYGTN